MTIDELIETLQEIKILHPLAGRAIIVTCDELDSYPLQEIIINKLDNTIIFEFNI
jgi:hypothetical protein